MCTIEVDRKQRKWHSDKEACIKSTHGLITFKLSNPTSDDLNAMNTNFRYPTHPKSFMEMYMVHYQIYANLKLVLRILTWRNRYCQAYQLTNNLGPQVVARKQSHWAPIEVNEKHHREYRWQEFVHSIFSIWNNYHVLPASAAEHKVPTNPSLPMPVWSSNVTEEIGESSHGL